MDQDLEKKLADFLERQELKRHALKGIAYGGLIVLAFVGILAIVSLIAWAARG